MAVAKKVLVIEDNPLNMKLVRQLISISKHLPLEAANAEDGIALAREENPDLILIDIQLPGMDGLAAAGVIKADPVMCDIPVIALTAHAMEGDERKAIAAGCDGYLSKPIDARRFFKLLQSHLSAVDEKAATSGAAGRAPTPCKNVASILVVDDDPLNVKLLEATLGAKGYRILKAYNGCEALETVDRSPPDLILLDIMMPEMDGYEVVRRLKAGSGTRNIPVVLITALEGRDEKAKGLEAGADEFLNKPVNTTELETRVLSLLRMKKYQEQLNARTQVEKDLLKKSREGIICEEDAPWSRVLVVEDNIIDAHLIAGYLSDLPLSCRIVSTGAEAIDILQNETIDLVLLDLMLPDISGIDVCRRIKENEKTMAVQVVLATTLDDLKVKIRGIEQGADDFLVKPLHPDEIKARVTALLKKKAFMDSLADRASAALQAAITDKLTGVYNRAYFKHFIDLEVKRTKRQGDKMALMMVDADNFKQFNDTYGHLAGDGALEMLGRVLKDSVRDVDVVARYGGEEFVVVLPYAGWPEGRSVSERLLEAVKDCSIRVCDDAEETARITVSIGLAVFPDNGLSSEQMISAADAALYTAKRCGKNRVCCAGTLEN